MATVPSGTRFIGIATSVDLTERKSAVLNKTTEPFTIEDIASTVGVGANVTKVVKTTITPLQVQSLFTTPIKVIQGVSGKGIMPIQILVLSNNEVAGYSPSGGLLQLKHEGSNTVVLSSSTGLGSFGDLEAYGLSVSSLSRGGFTTDGVSVFANLSTANPVGGDGGLILHIVYNEITF